METNITSALAESAILLGVGMVVVFVFLTLLIGAVQLISYLCEKFPEASESIELPKAAQSSALNQDVVEAIRIAVKQYRASN